jgi:hypothetical protein
MRHTSPPILRRVSAHFMIGAIAAGVWQSAYGGPILLNGPIALAQSAAVAAGVNRFRRTRKSSDLEKSNRSNGTCDAGVKRDEKTLPLHVPASNTSS